MTSRVFWQTNLPCTISWCTIAACCRALSCPVAVRSASDTCANTQARTHTLEVEGIASCKELGAIGPDKVHVAAASIAPSRCERRQRSQSQQHRRRQQRLKAATSQPAPPGVTPHLKRRWWNDRHATACLVADVCFETPVQYKHADNLDHEGSTPNGKWLPTYAEDMALVI